MLYMGPYNFLLGLAVCLVESSWRLHGSMWEASQMGNSRLPAGFYKETSHMETRLHTYRLHVGAVLAM